MDNKETVELTQTMTDLEAGKTYMALAAVENKSDRKAYIEVETSDGNCISNYTERSIVKNYIGVNSHNTENTDSYMQNMPVVFTVPEGADTAVLKLRVEKGSGTVLFDELRVVETLAQNQTSETVFEQDFEQVVQGLYPFVVSNHQGRPTDVKVHLSEKNAPYTQKGWNDRIIDDVLNGDWSIKVHQLTNLKGVVLQTIPQTYRFEPGQKYKISFSYEAGADDSYALIVSNKENVRGVIDADHEQLTNSKYADEPTKVSFELTGHENGQTWFGIYSNASNINESTAGKKPWKLGKADIVIDDIRIEKIVEGEAVDKSELQALLAEHKDKQQGSYTDASWNVFETALADAEAVWKNDKATKDEVTSVIEALQKAVDGLRKEDAADKTKLQEAYDTYKDVKQEGYTKKSWDSFQETLKEAQIVLEGEAATQEAIDKAAQALIEAVSALEKEVVIDTEALKLTLKAANALEESLYTSESWEALQKAITDAQEVLHDQSATQEQIDEIKGKLEKAIVSLEKKETPEDPEEPIKPVDPADPEQPIEETMISNVSNTIFVIGKLDKAMQLITKEYSSDEIKAMLKNLQDNELWKKSKIEKVFDIYLLNDGVVVQPDGTITVRIKVDAQLLAKELKIFYLDQEGKATEMKTRKGSEYIEFDTDHLSAYAIVSQKKEISNVVDTGDHSNTGMILMMLLISGSAIIMLLKKKEA